MSRLELSQELRERISSSLNEFTPRPLTKRLLIEGGVDEAKQIVEVPNLADHPLVVGPRYTPRELSLSCFSPLGYRSSGLSVHVIGSVGNRRFRPIMLRTSFVNIYHLTGRFGYVTDNFFSDGKVQDKSTFKHIRSGRLDAALSRIESNQSERLFDSSNVPLDSQEAYELAKAWPSRPPKMATWPVIYRLRCIHLKLPEFKIEVTVCNENENFLAQLIHEIGQILKSAAYTESIRRIQVGPFSVNDSLTDRDWDLQTIIDHLYKNSLRDEELYEAIKSYRRAMPVRIQYNQPES